MAYSLIAYTLMAYTLMAYNLMEYTLMVYFDQMQYSNVQTNRYITFVMNVDGILQPTGLYFASRLDL